MNRWTKTGIKTAVALGLCALMGLGLAGCGSKELAGAASRLDQLQQQAEQVASAAALNTEDDPYASFYTNALETTFTASYNNTDTTMLSFKYPKEMEPYNDGLNCMNPYFGISLDRGTRSYSDSTDPNTALADAENYLRGLDYQVTTLTVDGRPAVRGIVDQENNAGGTYIIYSDEFGPSGFFTADFAVMQGHAEEYAAVMDKIVAGFQFL